MSEWPQHPGIPAEPEKAGWHRMLHNTEYDMWWEPDAPGSSVAGCWHLAPPGYGDTLEGGPHTQAMARYLGPSDGSKAF